MGRAGRDSKRHGVAYYYDRVGIAVTQTLVVVVDGKIRGQEEGRNSLLWGEKEEYEQEGEESAKDGRRGEGSQLSHWVREVKEVEKRHSSACCCTSD